MKALAVAVSFVALHCHAQSTIYAYSDERGVLHLTDAPDDGRYRALGEPEAASPAKTSKAVRPYEALIDRTARAYGLDPALVHAVVSVESGYDARAVSKRGAAGLMQLMAPTAARYGVSDRLDPSQNLRAGTQHLRELLELFANDLELALAAYNAGVQAVERHGRRIPPYAETQSYVPRVLRAYAKRAQ